MCWQGSGWNSPRNDKLWRLAWSARTDKSRNSEDYGKTGKIVDKKIITCRTVAHRRPHHWGDRKMLGKLVENGAGQWTDQRGSPWVVWYEVPVPLTSTRPNARGYEITDLSFNSDYILVQKVPRVWTVDKEISEAGLHNGPDDCKLLLLTIKEKKQLVQLIISYFPSN